MTLVTTAKGLFQQPKDPTAKGLFQASVSSHVRMQPSKHVRLPTHSVECARRDHHGTEMLGFWDSVTWD